MKPIRWEHVVIAACAILAGCSSVSLAPGADQIKATSNAADVAACASLGALDPPPPMMTDPDVERLLRNETLAIGGNVLLFSSPVRRSGSAYRCGDAGAPVGLAAPAPAAKPVPAPIEIVQAQVDAYNRHDLEGFLAFYTDDAQILDYPDRVLMSGKDAMRERYRMTLEPAQLHASILHRIVFDRFVIDQERITGRADGEVVEAVVIYEIRDGRIVKVTLLRR